MAIEELAISFESKPLPAKASAYLAEANRRIDRLFESGRNKRIPRFIPSDAIAIYNALDFITSEDFPLGRVYCEWGSGYGIGSCFAALLGYEAYGIEIEPWLVEQSAQLATKFDSSATFAEGSFVPPEYQGETKHLDSERIPPTDGACAFDEIGLELTDFDLIFAYPWPGEEEWLYELMRRHARPDAILLTYDAQECYRSKVVSRL